MINLLESPKHPRCVFVEGIALGPLQVRFSFASNPFLLPFLIGEKMGLTWDLHGRYMGGTWDLLGRYYGRRVFQFQLFQLFFCLSLFFFLYHFYYIIYINVSSMTCIAWWASANNSYMANSKLFLTDNNFSQSSTSYASSQSYQSLTNK